MPSDAAPAEYAIGVDVGVTNVKVVAVASDGRELRRDSVGTESARPDWPTRVRDLVLRIESKQGRSSRLGLAAPGIAAPHGRFISWMQGRLEEVQGLDWSALLGRPVPVLNDAQAALLGEVWLGAARGATNVLLLTLGTGVGGAAMVDGRVLKGHLGRAGHVGHISLDPYGPPDIVSTPGSLEDKVGNATVSLRTGGRFASTHELVAAVRSGDVQAWIWWADMVHRLAAGVASLVNVLDPEVVVIGGGIASAADALFDRLAKLMDRFEWRPHGARVRIVPAQLGEYAGAIGAAWNAMRTEGSDTE